MGKDVYVRKYLRGWVVRKLGASYATAVVETKKQAVEIGQYSAKKERALLIVLAEDGKEESRKDYGAKSKKKTARAAEAAAEAPPPKPKTKRATAKKAAPKKTKKPR